MNPSTLDELRRALRMLGYPKLLDGFQDPNASTRDAALAQVQFQFDNSDQSPEDARRRDRAVSVLARFPWETTASESAVQAAGQIIHLPTPRHSKPRIMKVTDVDDDAQEITVEAAEVAAALRAVAAILRAGRIPRRAAPLAP